MPVQEIDLGKVIGPPGPPGADGSPGERGPGTNTNLLDNWYFTDPINQRGKTEYSSLGYTIDRWMLTTRNYQPKVSLSTSGLQIESETSATGNGWFLAQRLELDRVAPGTYTLSVLADSCSGDVSMTVQLTNSPWTAFLQKTKIYQGLTTATFTVPALAPSDSQSVSVFLVGTVGTAVIKAVKLELGDTQTLAHQDADGNWVLTDPPPNKALELTKCQRYYLRADGNSGLFMLGVPSTGSNTLKLFVPTPVTMRVNPAVKISGTFVFDWSDDNGSTEPINYSGTANAWRNGVWVNPGNHSISFTDILFAIRTAQSEDGVVELSADL